MKSLRSWRTGRRLVAVALVAVAAVGLPVTNVVRSPAATAYPSEFVDLVGHGFGHGRGMGQYGALGYAIDHGWGYQQILGHYYTNTAVGHLAAGDQGNSVRITGRDGQDTIVVQERGGLRTTADGGAGSYTALRVRRTGPQTWQVATGSGCGGPWDEAGARIVTASSVTMSRDASLVGREDDPAVGDQHTYLLQICGSTGTRWYRGAVQAAECPSASSLPSCPSPNPQITVNQLGMDEYLRGVVPRESPASWGDLGGGKGIEALKAQAVAARSYAAAENRWPGVAKTCDTISCQVYLGFAESVNGLPFKRLEDSRTNRAIAETANEVRVRNGIYMRTEFSSSTGGHTAENSTLFSPVVDEGDDTASNPNHTWTTRLAVSAIEAKYGLGMLLSIEIRARNGLGEDGGRVRQMRLYFANGTVDRTGDQFRQDFALKSDWFKVVNQASFPYHVLTRDGGVFAYGGAPFHGSLGTVGVRVPARGLAEGRNGYWILGDDGGVFSFGAVQFHGSMGGQRLNQPVVGMASTPSGKGYWLVASDGGIFAFGDAAFFGSTGNIRLNQPIVGMSPTPSGKGYWLVASDGGIFAFGDAQFHGSTGNITLNQPVTAMAPNGDGTGYWLVAKDGGLFAFKVPFHGSLPGRNVRETAVAMEANGTGGYIIATAQGRLYAFGDAGVAGQPADAGAASPTVALGRARS